jgi:hypothetical protein
MATIYNSDLSKELREGGKLQVTDRMPSELAEKVVPVMEVNPKLLRRVNLLKNANSGGAFTLYAAPSNKDTFITGLSLAFHQIVTDTLTQVSISVTIDGAAIRLFLMPSTTLTINDQYAYLPFPTPIKVDRGTNISITVTGTVTQVWASLIGYQVDNINA